MNRRLNLVAQQNALQRLYPQAISRIQRSELHWRGSLKPTELSRTYVIKLTYKLRERPSVSVVRPALECRPGEDLPHVYPGNRLCLYLPRMAEWTNLMLIAETIVPWASEWLLHYEVWLATGEWTGGGEHPRATKKTES